MRWEALVLGAVLLAGCGDSSAVIDEDASSSGGDTTAPAEESSSSGDAVAGFCEGAVELRYDPAAGRIDAFPDDVLTESAQTKTGLRIRELGAELVDDEPLTGFPSLLEGLATLDGFGTTAPLFLRVAGSIDPASLPVAGSETDPAQSTLVLVDLDASEPSTSATRPRFVEFDWRLVEEPDGGTTLLVDPLRPLRAGARHGLVLTRAARSGDGECIAPSVAMREILAGEAGEGMHARVGEPIADLVALLRDAGTIADATDLSAAIVFTTQVHLHESTVIASAIAGGPATAGDTYRMHRTDLLSLSGVRGRADDGRLHRCGRHRGGNPRAGGVLRRAGDDVSADGGRRAVPDGDLRTRVDGRSPQCRLVRVPAHAGRLCGRRDRRAEARRSSR